MAISYRTDTVDGAAVLSYFPSEHKGVVYFFHGGKGSASKFSNNAKEVAEEAVRLGFGVVFFTAKGAKWDQVADMVTVAKTRDSLTARGLLKKGTKEFSVGHSAGGPVAAHAANNFSMAAALYSSAGDATLFKSNNYDRPTIFLPGEIDPTNPVTEVRPSYKTLKRRGVQTAMEIRMGEDHEFTATKMAEVFQFFAKARV